jgi:hypothetical protein
VDTKKQAIARQCLEGAEGGSMTFPQIVGALMAAGFDGYLVDLRLGQATYYLEGGEGPDLPTHRSEVEVAAEFNADVVQAAIGEAQTRIGLIALDGSSVVWLDVDPFFVFHFGNGFERAGHIFIDYVRHDRLNLGYTMARLSAYASESVSKARVARRDCKFRRFAEARHPGSRDPSHRTRILPAHSSRRHSRLLRCHHNRRAPRDSRRGCRARGAR